MADLEQGEPSVSFSRGFLLQLVVLMVTIVSGWVYIKSDLKVAIEMGIDNKAELRRYQSDMHSLQMEILSLQDNIKYFRESYERDMNKYVREGADKKR